MTTLSAPLDFLELLPPPPTDGAVDRPGAVSHPRPGGAPPPVDPPTRRGAGAPVRARLSAPHAKPPALHLPAQGGSAHLRSARDGGARDGLRGARRSAPGGAVHAPLLHRRAGDPARSGWAGGARRGGRPPSLARTGADHRPLQGVPGKAHPRRRRRPAQTGAVVDPPCLRGGGRRGPHALLVAPGSNPPGAASARRGALGREGDRRPAVTADASRQPRTVSVGDA